MEWLRGGGNYKLFGENEVIIILKVAYIEKSDNTGMLYMKDVQFFFNDWTCIQRFGSDSSVSKLRAEGVIRGEESRPFYTMN